MKITSDNAVVTRVFTHQAARIGHRRSTVTPSAPTEPAISPHTTPSTTYRWGPPTKATTNPSGTSTSAGPIQASQPNLFRAAGPAGGVGADAVPADEVASGQPGLCAAAAYGSTGAGNGSTAGPGRYGSTAGPGRYGSTAGPGRYGSAAGAGPC